MDSHSTIKRIDGSHTDHRHKRPAWRQHLVLTERGVVGGIRGGSAFFVHFFAFSIVLATGYVLGLALMQWVGIVLCITLVLAAEMFNQALRTLLAELRPEHLPTHKSKALGISTAAVMMTVLGGLIAIGLIFAQRLSQIWSH